MTVEPAASVVVPTHNRADIVARCLTALLAQRPGTPAFEIVVVDDASTDATPERVRALTVGAPHVRYLRHETNRGRSATRNTGIRAARGTYVVLLDDDIIVEPDYLRVHLETHAAAAPDRLVVVSNLSFPDSVVAGSNYARYLQSRYLGHRGRRDREGLDPSDLHPRFLGSGISSLRRDVLEAVGLFDEEARFYGYEDHLFGERLHRAGVRIVFAPGARALHHDTVSVAWYRAKMTEAGRDGLRLLRERHPEFLEATALVHLLPVDWSRDRPQRVLRKLALRAALNPLTLALLDRWAEATDRFGAVYSPLVYRALSAGWLLRGQKLERGGRPLVQYGG